MNIDFSQLTWQLAVRHGDREALVNIERRRRCSFRELHRLTNRIVNMMRECLGLRRGDRYLCILENDNLSLLHAWTALKGEATAVWTNFRDSGEEHRWQFEFTAPKVVFLENSLLDRYFGFLRERGITVVCMDRPPSPRDGLHYFWDLMEGVSEGDPGIQSDATRDVLICRFTGGTTAKSKCAQYTMDNWLAARDSYYVDCEQPFDSESRMLHMAPISHGSGLAMLSTLFRGGCAVTQNAADLKQWCRNIEEEKVTVSLLVPTLLYRLLDMPEATRHDLSTLRTIVYGAAPMSPSKLGELQRRFGNIFMQVYGATEFIQNVTILGKADHVAGARYLASAGKVSPMVELLVVDENGRRAPLGSTGEIWLRGRGTVKGYFNNPEGTAAEFADGYWKSGDLGYLDEGGFLYIVDRKKDMIITGGFNVYAVEVEAALSSHPAVSVSAVVGIPHEEWGEAVHAEVVLKEGRQASPEELIDHVKGLLGRFKAPKTVALVDKLPVTAVGKVLRREVRAKYWKGQARKVN